MLSFFQAHSKELKNVQHHLYKTLEQGKLTQDKEKNQNIGSGRVERETDEEGR